MKRSRARTSRRHTVTTLAAIALVTASACSGTDTPTIDETSTAPGVETTATTPVEGFDLDRIVGDFVGEAKGGAAVLVVRDGVVTTSVAGTATASGETIETDTPFRAGSISKTFVATMILQMVDEDLVDLDTTLGTYLPNTPVGGATTIRSLLSHQSGLPNYTDQPQFFADVLADRAHTYTPDDMLTYIADVPTGTAGRFSYSNTNYILLGQLVEQVDGTSLNESLQTRVSIPLGLAATAFVGGGVAAPLNLAGGWSAGVSSGERLSSYESIASSAWSAGALVSTIEDLQTFITVLFDGELMSVTALDEMTAVGSDGYGLGIFVAELGIGNPGFAHNGSIPGYSSTMGISPESGDIIVVLTNNDALIADLLAPQIIRSW